MGGKTLKMWKSVKNVKRFCPLVVALQFFSEDQRGRRRVVGVLAVCSIRAWFRVLGAVPVAGGVSVPSVPWSPGTTPEERGAAHGPLHTALTFPFTVRPWVRMNVPWETYSVWLIGPSSFALCLDYLSFPLFICRFHCFCVIAALCFFLSFSQALGKPKPLLGDWQGNGEKNRLNWQMPQTRPQKNPRRKRSTGRKTSPRKNTEQKRATGEMRRDKQKTRAAKSARNTHTHTQKKKKQQQQKRAKGCECVLLTWSLSLKHERKKRVRGREKTQSAIDDDDDDET